MNGLTGKIPEGNLHYRLNGQSTEHPEHPLCLLPHEQPLFPIRRMQMATMTRAKTTSNTMTVAQFMRKQH